MHDNRAPFVSVEGERTAAYAGQQLRVPVTFERPLPFVPRPLSLLWSELINARYMGAEAVSVEGVTLVWESERPGYSHVRAMVMLLPDNNQG